MPSKKRFLSDKLSLLNLRSRSKDHSKATASAPAPVSGVVSNNALLTTWKEFLEEYHNELFAYIWETRQEREIVWKEGYARLFPNRINALISREKERLERHSQSCANWDVWPDHSKYELGQFYNSLPVQDDPFQPWLILARCVSYRFEGIEPDVEVLRLSLSRLADDMFGTNVSVKSIVDMWTRTLGNQNDFDSLGNNECSLCKKTFSIGDRVKQIRWREA